MSQQEKIGELRSLLTKGPMEDIYFYERARELYFATSDQADEINSAGYGAFISCVQHSLVVEMVIYTARMFDSNHQYQTRSFPGILNFIEKHADVLPVSVEHMIYSRKLDGEPLVLDVETSDGFFRSVERWVGGSVEAKPNPSELKTFVQTIRAGLPSLAKVSDGHGLSKGLELLKRIRDKEVAHNEHVSVVERPSFEILEELGVWAKATLEALARCFAPDLCIYDDNGTFVFEVDALKPSISFNRLVQNCIVSNQSDSSFAIAEGSND